VVIESAREQAAGIAETADYKKRVPDTPHLPGEAMFIQREQEMRILYQSKD